MRERDQGGEGTRGSTPCRRHVVFYLPVPTEMEEKATHVNGPMKIRRTLSVTAAPLSQLLPVLSFRQSVTVVFDPDHFSVLVGR